MIPEVKAYLDSMDGMRRSMRRAIEGVDSRCLNWNPLPGEANSLYAIVAHMCAAEPIMIHQRVSGQPVTGTYMDAFAESGDDPQELCDALDRVGRTTRSLMEGLSAEDLDRSYDPGAGRPPRTLREWFHFCCCARSASSFLKTSNVHEWLRVLDSRYPPLHPQGVQMRF